LPPALADALTAAEQVLRDHDRVRAVLIRTHDAIPAALRVRAELQDQLAEAELNGKDTKVLRERRLVTESERLSFVGQRQGAIQALLDGETGLTERRDVLVAEKDQYARKATEAFRVKYDAAVLALQTAWATGDELARAMRCDVPMPLPVRATGGPVPTISGIGCPESEPVRLHRVPGPDSAPPPIDAVAARIGATLDRLGTAIDLANGLRAALRMQSQAQMRESLRGWNPAGAYVVVREFICHTDGLPFLPNQIIDASLLGLVSLQRAVASKSVRLLESAEAVAA
jgi:hypothetical protein